MVPGGVRPPSFPAEPGRTRACGGPEARWVSPGARGGTGSAGCRTVAPESTVGPVVPGVLEGPVSPRVLRVSGSLGVLEAPEVPGLLEVPGVSGHPGGPLAVMTGTWSPPRRTQSPGTSASGQSLDSGKPGGFFQTQDRPIVDHQLTTEGEGLTWRGCTTGA